MINSKLIIIVLVIFILLGACGGSKPTHYAVLPTLETTQVDQQTPTAMTEIEQQPTKMSQSVNDESQISSLLFCQERVRSIDGAVEIFIPAGEFVFGCIDDHNGGYECMGDELPSRRLTLEAYFIDKYEVSNAQYAACVASGGCFDPVYRYSSTREAYYGNPEFDNYPAVNISWYEASAYCAWVGGRLPTEAEWEKAARGTDSRAFPWGDSAPTCKLASYRDETGGEECAKDTMPQGAYPEGASPYGVMDLAGNVWEWVQDWYVLSPSGARLEIDPFEENLDLHKVVKGGSWDYSWSRLRISCNSDHAPNEHKLSFGFRCVNPTK